MAIHNDLGDGRLGDRGMRKTPLRRVSVKKAAWNSKYRAALKSRAAVMIGLTGKTWCERCLVDTPNVEGHHPKGQQGENIMNFKLVGNNFSRCRCHNWIESHKNEARKEGWIQY